MDKTRNQRSTNYRFVILGLIASMGFSIGLNLFPIGTVTPLIIANYGVNNSAAGLLTSIVFLVQCVLAIPVSTIVDKIGVKTMVTLAGLVGSVTTLSFVATDSFYLLLLTRAIYGSSAILFFPAIGPLLMQWFRPKELPLANGCLMISISLGISISTFLIAPLSETIGWASGLSAFGGVSLLSAVTWVFFGKALRIPRATQQFSLVRRVLGILRDRNTLLVAAADAGPLALLTVSLGWLPTFYYDVHGTSLAEGGTLMGVLSLSGFAALILASIMTIRIHKRRPFLIIPGIMTGFAGFASFLLPGSWVLYMGVAVLGFACWFYIPALITIPMELYPNDPGRVSIILAAFMTIGGVASFVSPPTVGAFADVTGSFLPGLAFFAILSWSLGIAGMLLPETGAISAKEMPNSMVTIGDTKQG